MTMIWHDRQGQLTTPLEIKILALVGQANIPSLICQRSVLKLHALFYELHALSSPSQMAN